MAFKLHTLYSLVIISVSAAVTMGSAITTNVDTVTVTDTATITKTATVTDAATVTDTVTVMPTCAPPGGGASENCVPSSCDTGKNLFTCPDTSFVGSCQCLDVNTAVPCAALSNSAPIKSLGIPDEWTCTLYREAGCNVNSAIQTFSAGCSPDTGNITARSISCTQANV